MLPMQLPYEPALLQGRAGPGEIESVSEQERLGLGQVQEQGLDHIPSQGLDRLHAAIAVHQDKLRRLPDHEHRRLLADLRDRRRHSCLVHGIGDAQRLVAKYELMEFDLHGSSLGRAGPVGR